MYKQSIPWIENNNENEIPPYQLPDPLLCGDGSRIVSAEDWKTRRRPELLTLFRDIMYGNPPPMPDKIQVTLLTEKKDARNGTAVRREFMLDFRMDDGRRHSVIVLLYIPSQVQGKVPVCVNLTFGGNQTLTDEPDVIMTGLQGKRDSRFLAPHRNSRCCPIDLILQHGYALAIASYHDFFPDFADSWGASIYELFRNPEELAPGSRPKDASAIAAWAWGYSRVLDGVLSFPEIDEKKAFCIGHSRLGKSALWAGVQDERFGMVCVNNSGCGGAALSRRLFGETIYSMYWYFNIGEWWFTEKMKEYAVHVENLPFDQHELLALAAPRTVVVHSASEDLWADPKGEYLAAYHAGPVYRLFGKTGLNSEKPPPPDQAVGTDIRYFMRTGGHDLLLADWQHYLAAADSVFDSEP